MALDQEFEEESEEGVEMSFLEHLEELRWNIPVSYTHLDVYKRQGL